MQLSFPTQVFRRNDALGPRSVDGISAVLKRKALHDICQVLPLNRSSAFNREEVGQLEVSAILVRFSYKVEFNLTSIGELPEE